MKKLFALLVLSLFVLTGVALFYYTHWHSGHQIARAVPCIPQSAALVYDVPAASRQWDYLRQMTVDSSSHQLPALAFIQRALGTQEALPEQLEQIPLTISLHGVDEESLGVIFYLDTSYAATRVLIKTFLSNIDIDKSYSRVEKEHAGYKITTLSQQGTTKQLAYVSHDSYFIASFSPSLVDDVVQALSSGCPEGLLDLKKSPLIQGGLCVNFSRLAELLPIFVELNQVSALSRQLATFSHVAQLDVSFGQRCLLLSGLTNVTKSSSKYFVNTLAEQSAGGIPFVPYLPQSAAVLQYFNFSEVDQLLKALREYKGKTPPTPSGGSGDLLADTFEPFLSGEIGHCILTDDHSQLQTGELVLMKTVDFSACVEALESAGMIATSSLQVAGSSTNLYELQPCNFRSRLLDQLFPTFEARYLAQVDGYLVFADSKVTVHSWFSQLNQNKTWVDTIPQGTWSSGVLERSHWGLLIDPSKVWSRVVQLLKPKWKSVFEAYDNVLRGLPYCSVQLLCESNSSSYLSILLAHGDEACSSQKRLAQSTSLLPKANSVDQATNFPFFQAESPIIHAPWLVQSHRGEGYYTLLQDSLYQLYFLDPSGNLLWKKPLKGPIKTDVFEIDFYKNNKIQYLFATDSQLHLVDYHGSKVADYPYRLPQPAQHLQVVDYDRNKHYRFLIATERGDIYLKNKQFEPLPAWNPKSFGDAFPSAPFHIRLPGKDYFLAVQTNGTVQAINRRGQSCPGFPVRLKTAVSNPLLIRKGKSATDTTLIGLTDTGRYFGINLANGKIHADVRPESSEGSVHFMACPSQATNGSHAIVRIDANSVTVMDEALSVLFTFPCQTARLLVQYFDFGDDLRFYSFTDPDQQRTYLYDRKGGELTNIPLESEREVGISFSKKKNWLEVYSCVAMRCMRYILPLEQDIQSR